jgi:DNA-binding transcriptional LysR family regulator
MSQIDVRQLEYFVAVAEELNFTRAAQRCHVVQSALSYQIARLERETGVTLFERTSRSVAMAPGGRVLLPRARHILAELDLAAAELTALAGVLTGRLRLGMIGSAVAAPVVEGALVTFHRRHPGVEITVEDTGSADMAVRIRGGDLDLAFVGLFADQVPADLAHRVLTVEPLVAVLPSGHPLAATAHPVDLSALAGDEFVEMRAESGLRHQVDAAFARAGVGRSIAFELSTSDNVVRFVQLGFGVAVVPRSAADGRDVAVLALADTDAVHPVSLVHRAPTPSAPSAQALLALLDGGVGPAS